MPRPRTVDDADILEATRQVMGRVGPGKFTLALVAHQIGLAPATLIQRFGSKRGLLVSLAGSGRVDAAAVVQRLLEKHGSPVQALREYLRCFADMASTPEEMANHLAFFQMDLTDPELRRIALRITRSNEATVAALIREALDAKELKDCKPAELAPILLTVAQGSLLNWALVRKGTAKRWVARHIDITLRPYLTRRPRRRPGS